MHVPQDCSHALELPTGVKETCWKDHLKFLSLWQWKVKSECKSELIRCISWFLQKLLLLSWGCSKLRNYVSVLLCTHCTHNNRHLENLVKPSEFSGLVRRVWGETLIGFWQQSFRRQTNRILKHLGHSSTSSCPREARKAYNSKVTVGCKRGCTWKDTKITFLPVWTKRLTRWRKYKTALLRWWLLM